MEKKLGRWMLLELVERNDVIKIDLYKKWFDGEGYECTDHTYYFKKEEYEKALNVYNKINLKNIYEKLKELREEGRNEYGKYNQK